jgi:cardiolipin synthase
MAPRRPWLTGANTLTLLRLLAAPALLLAIVRDAPLAASALFALAVASDFGDGWLARRRGDASPLGGLADHAADAVFVTSGTVALAWMGVLPAALPPLIALAFLQYALDSRVLSSRGLRPNSLGRANGVAYYAIVAVPIVRDSMGLDWPGPPLVRGLGWALVGTTLVSMLDRLRLLLGRRSE